MLISHRYRCRHCGKGAARPCQNEQETDAELAALDLLLRGFQISLRRALWPTSASPTGSRPMAG